MSIRYNIYYIYTIYIYIYIFVIRPDPHNRAGQVLA